MTKKFKLVGDAPEPNPAPPLGDVGRALWDRVNSEYAIEDAGGVAMLTLACSALDRASRCREQIDKDGELVHTKSGAREHPLIKAELAAMAFVVRTLARLGLNFEPVRSGVGRPGEKGFVV
jgi:hypothetical protein